MENWADMAETLTFTPAALWPLQLSSATSSLLHRFDT